MEEKLSYKDVIALRDLETEHAKHHSFKGISWVLFLIVAVIVLAIIFFWIRKSRDNRHEEYRYDGENRREFGEHRGAFRCLEKQVDQLQEKAYFNFGKLEKLYGEVNCYMKYNTHEVEELENRCYPKGYIGFEGCEFRGERGRRFGCGDRDDRHGNCSKKFVRQDTYTPNTQQVIVTEDCNCG